MEIKEQEVLAEAKENVLYSLSKALLDAREAKAHTEEALRLANEAVSMIEQQLIELMIGDELTSFKRDGVQFSLVSKAYISVEAERKPELYAELKQRGYEGLFSVNANTLSGEVKRLIEENYGTLPAWLDGLVRQYDKPSIRVRK